MARASGSGGDEPSDDEMAVMDPYMAMLLVDDEGSTSPVSPKRSKRPRTDAIPAKFQHREHHLMYLNVVAIMMTWRRFLKRSRSSVTGAHGTHGAGTIGLGGSRIVAVVGEMISGVVIVKLAVVVAVVVVVVGIVGRAVDDITVEDQKAMVHTLLMGASLTARATSNRFSISFH